HAGPRPKAAGKAGVDNAELSRLLLAPCDLPIHLQAHPKIKKLLDLRRAMATGQEPLDWSAAEALAFATIATEGHRVRLSGQDSGRGTFSQRHAILSDYEDGHIHIPLQHLAPNQAPVNIYNSPLSEAGVLGSDYGYSLDC